MSQQNFFFTRKPKSNCGYFLRFWADQHKVPIRSTASVRASVEDKRAPHSELCMQTRCAGKPVRMFAVDKKHGVAAIGYMDKGSCQFTSGSMHEVLPPGFWRSAGLSGARSGRKRRRRR